MDTAVDAQKGGKSPYSDQNEGNSAPVPRQALQKPLEDDEPKCRLDASCGNRLDEVKVIKNKIE